jgi:hypothetical protein
MGQAFQEIPIMIPTNRHGSGSIEKDHQIRGSSGLQRAAEAIAEIDDVANAKQSNILEHGLKGRAISMNIGNRGKAHQLPR